MNGLLRASCLPLVFVIAPLAVLPAFAQKPSPQPTFSHDIRPILQTRCVVCHNAESLSNLATSGGLDLSSYEGLKRGIVSKGVAASIISGGKAPGGSLIERLSTTSPTRMMPRGGPPLPPEQIALFKKWIAAGAPAGAT